LLKSVGFLQYIKKDWLDATIAFYLNNRNLEYVKANLHQLIEPECQKKEERRKTIDVLTRSWIRMPPKFKKIQSQAMDIHDEILPEERLILHWGMLLMSYPFFRDIAYNIGSIVKLQDSFSSNQLRNKMISTWGHRTTIIRAIDRVIQSMKDWDVISQHNKSLKVNSPILIKNSKLCLWLLESAYRSENLDSILFDKLISIPTIFPFKLDISAYKIKTAESFEHHIQALNIEMISLRQK